MTHPKRRALTIVPTSRPPHIRQRQHFAVLVDGLKRAIGPPGGAKLALDIAVSARLCACFSRERRHSGVNGQHGKLTQKGPKRKGTGAAGIKKAAMCAAGDGCSQTPQLPAGAISVSPPAVGLLQPQFRTPGRDVNPDPWKGKKHDLPCGLTRFNVLPSVEDSPPRRQSPTATTARHRQESMIAHPRAPLRILPTPPSGRSHLPRLRTDHDSFRQHHQPASRRST